ncbi:MAG: exodeoxyribonuclease I [Gammaproteobacteria bacterium]|nr:exodeoxyribonuclease I [Gammaproteobacteria bacterium]
MSGSLLIKNNNSIYWYDLETFGINSRRDRIAQFAGVRTDENLNIISDPLVSYCRLSDEILPDPISCQVTGITPSIVNEKGVNEAAFIRAINQVFTVPNTCVAGYNNIRFDDEFIRNTLYRNFYDPYEREWKNGNSRWDIIDMVRLTCALRPEGINWPNNKEGVATFKLEKLTQANNIAHEMAHDALSDVYATIALAKLVQKKQPKLFEFLYRHRNKHAISNYLKIREAQPVIHVSSKYPATKNCMAIVVPLAIHPTNQNAYIVYDLSIDPTELINLDIKSIQERIFTPTDQLKNDETRIPLKAVHINKCPVIVPLNTLDSASAQRLNINVTRCLEHLARIKSHSTLGNKVQQVFVQDDFEKSDDPEFSLYAGFLNNNDKQKMQQIRNATEHEINKISAVFDDRRLPALFLHYKARNFPATLTDDEQQAWNDYRHSRLLEHDNTNTLSLVSFRERIQSLKEDNASSADKTAILDELLNYSMGIKLPELNK